jgi:hypothetical protein
MAFVDPTTPNLADFITFSQNQGLSSTYLSPTSPYYQWALTFAQDVTITVPQMAAIEYVIAVYNLGFHHLLMIAQDQSGLGITSLAWASGQVTVTTTTALTASVGSTVNFVISGTVPLAYNVTYDCVVTGTNTFVYALATNPGTVTQAGSYGTNFFATQRANYNLLAFSAGAISASSDQGTSESTLNPEFFKYLTFSDLNVMQTPWGRAYLSYAQTYGPNIVEYS